MDISINTKLVLFLGKPLGQSISTSVINLAYQEEGLDFVRIPVEAAPEDLSDLVLGMRKLNLAGFNVTKPNKIEILQYLDQLDPLAEAIGAVNCVTCRDGVWKGCNTDAEGFLASLKSRCEVTDKTFFCLGAGGTGRAICFALAQAGAKRLFITDLCQAAAQSLADSLNAYCSGSIAEWITAEAEKNNAIRQADVILNASGIGMAPHLDESPMDPALLSPHQLVFDAVYNPAKTRLLKDAEKAGCTFFNGREMVMNCNRIGFGYITGKIVTPEKWSTYMEAAERLS